MLRIFTLLIGSLFLMSDATGQGFISGVVKDASSGDPIPFAKVKVEGKNLGANTDFDGAFKIKSAADDYVIIVSMTMDGYVNEKRVVKIVDNEVLVLNFNLKKDASIQNMTEAKVVYTKTEGAVSIEADDRRRRDAQGASDGMTKEQIQNSGASSAVEAVQMVPGLSIEDG